MQTTFTPTKHQLDTLILASDYATAVWRGGLPAAGFLAENPLETALTGERIAELVHAWAQVAFINEFESAESAERQLKKALRELRALMMLRWIWADALSVISLENLTRELSDFADACLCVAKTYARSELVKRFGEPVGKDGSAQDLIIVAMGKLGARELNLSSDIDLVFLYGVEGRTQATDGGQKPIESKRFMVLLGQKIIRIIDDVTADGFVYRVDMRLRPWGDGSDLAINLNALRIYFTKHGRQWERFAWLKARVVGDSSLAEQLDDIIKPFVYRYYVDYTAFAALREMKNLIMVQQRQRFDEDNIKLGAGGIRDIEFIVQAYQLIYGGTEPQLQVKSCLAALEKIRHMGLVADGVAQDLSAAYRFLRRTEHAIQALEDKQTQRLPKTEPVQARLAAVLGFASWQAYLTQLNAHKTAVTAPFDKLVTERTKSAEVLDGQDQDQLRADNLSADDEAKLTAFLQSSTVKRLPAEARARLDDVWGEVCLAIAMSGNTEIATERMVRFLEAVVNRSIYLVLLRENPNALRHLVRMMVASPWISRELTRYPVLLDEFLQKRFQPLPSKAELVDGLRQKLLRVEPDDEEGQMAALRLFKKSQVLHTAASDLLADKPLMKVSDALTFIAETVLEAALKLVYTRLTRQYGYPKLTSGVRADATRSGFGVVGYGKLGGIELSYASDLDVVFLHSIDEQVQTNGDKPIGGMRFATRVGQKLMTLLGAQTRDGRAYEVDTRLRPSGRSGVLVASLAAFTNYQKNSAWLWEHQALVRARPICGDHDVLLHFTKIHKDTLCAERDLAEVRTEVLKMRQKMRDHLGSDKTERDAGLFHLKQDAGGIIDIEFMAQLCVLVLSAAHPELTGYPDNVRIFEQMASLAVKNDTGDIDIDAAECKQLAHAYLHIRAATHHLALAEKSLQVPASDWQSTRELVTKMWHKLVASD